MRRDIKAIQFALITAASLLLISCAPEVDIVKYDKTLQPKPADCQLETYIETYPVDRSVEVVGDIKVDDTLFSTNCDSHTVMKLIQTNACQAGADAIQVHNIRHPDWTSTCFRAEAKFLRYTETDKNKYSSNTTSNKNLDNSTTLSTQYLADNQGERLITNWIFRQGSISNDAVMVIIGNRNYRRGVPPVHYAINDAKAMREFARQGLGLNIEDIIYEEDATKGVMEGVFESTLPSRVMAGKKTVLIYFSGHGMATSNDASLLPVDARPSTASVTGYSRNSLMRQLADLDAKTTLILDACYTGTGKDGAPLLDGKPIFQAPKQAWVPDNVTLIAASSGSQIAWTYEKHGQSLMTYYLLRGLQGDADKDKDGEIDSYELSPYLKRTVNRAALTLHEQPQEPEILGANQVLINRR